MIKKENIINFNVVKKGLFGKLINYNELFILYNPFSNGIIKVNKSSTEIITILLNDNFQERINKLILLGKDYSTKNITSCLKIFDDFYKQERLNLGSSSFNYSISNYNANSNDDLMFSQIILEITQNCNLKCHYCIYSSDEYKFIRNHNTKKMDEIVLYEVLDFFLNNSISSPTITFFGGEPLLQTDIIKKAIDYTILKKPVAKFVLQTNGTLLDKNFFSFFKKFNGGIIVSLDGEPEIHDRYRKTANGDPTFDKIIKNLEKIGQLDLDYLTKKIQLQYTIADLTKFEDLIAYYNKHELLKKFSVRINLVSDIGLDENSKLYKEMSVEWSQSYLKPAINRYVNGLLSGDLSRVTIEHALFKGPISSILFAKKNKIIPGSLCKLGKDKLFVHVDGKYRVCQQNFSIPEVGNSKSGIKWNSLDKINNDFLETCNPCHTCWAFKLCSICWRHIYHKPGLVDREVKTKFCKKEQRWIELCLGIYATCIEKDPEIFNKNYRLFQKTSWP